MEYVESNIMIKENLLFNALSGAAAVIDKDGEITNTNKNWKSNDHNFHWFGVKPDTTNYFDHCAQAVKNGNDYALKLIFGIRNVLDGEKDKFEIIVPCNKGFEKCWFKVTVTEYDKKNRSALILVDDESKNMRTIQSLRESEEIYSQHFRHSHAGIILGTPDGVILDINPAGCKILGYTREELLKGGRSLISDEKNPINKKANAARNKNSFFEGEKVYTNKSGAVLTVEVASVLYKNENGELRVINTFRDKSKEKETLQNLKEERRFTKTVINSTPNIFFVINEEFKLVRWNEAFETELGYEKEFIQRNSARFFFTDEDKIRVAKVAKEAFVTGTGHMVAEVISRKNGIRHFHFHANKFTSNGEAFLVGTATDITDLIEVEKDRDKNYELISQLFESSPLGMVMLSKDNKIMKVNNSFTELFGYNKLELIGESLSERIVPENEKGVYNDFVKSVFSGRIEKREVIRHSRSGKELNIIVNAVPIWQNDEVVAAYGIYVDLTEQKKLEMRIQKSLNEKEVLLQEVHHRVKNNLAVIAGLLDLQIMEEEDQQIENKLNEVRSRIFSIAKIHETLYEKEDVVHIRFDDYLNTMMSALPQMELTDEEVNVTMQADHVTLNLNQAVPCGLAVNELMNIIFLNSDSLSDLNVKLSEKEGIVELIFSSDQLNLCAITPENNLDVFQNKLIDVFLTQISGSLMVKEDIEKQVILRFKKMNLRGSSSSVMNNTELVSN